jgi:hypothetical protein
LTALLLTLLNCRAQFDCSFHYRNAAIDACDSSQWVECTLFYDRFRTEGGVLNAYDHRRLACASIHLGDTTKCIDHLRKGVLLGLVWDGDGTLSLSSTFLPTASWLTKRDIDYEECHGVYMSKLDIPLMTQIASLKGMDQFVRTASKPFMSDTMHACYIHYTDSIGLVALYSIFDRYNGFPADSIIDQNARFALILLVQHAIRTFPLSFDHLFSIMRSAALRYSISPTELAAMMDRRSYAENGTTIYGEVPFRDSLGRSSLDNIQHVDHVDSLRYSLGLRSLGSHARSRNITPPLGYRPMPDPCLTP